MICLLLFNGRCVDFFNCMDMMQPEWHVGDDSSLEAIDFLTVNPTPERRLSVDGFPDQKRVKSAPTS